MQKVRAVDGNQARLLASLLLYGNWRSGHCAPGKDREAFGVNRDVATRSFPDGPVLLLDREELLVD